MNQDQCYELLSKRQWRYKSLLSYIFCPFIIFLFLILCRFFLKVFMNAAAFSQLDKLNGVTENVMLGQLGRFGSGFVDLLLDDSKLAASMDLLGLTQSLG